MATKTATPATKGAERRPAPKSPPDKGRKKPPARPCPEELDLPRPSREDYAETVEEQLADFAETLDGFETDLESSGWDEVGEFRASIDDLRNRLKEIRSQSHELESVEDSAWPSTHEDMEKTLLEMSDSIKEISVELGRVLPE